MAFLVNMNAFDRGSKLIEDMQREEREAAIRAKDDARQAERDARDRTRFEQEQSDRTKRDTAASALLDSIKQSPVTTGMQEFFDRRSPQGDAEAGQAQPPAAVADNPVQSNVMDQQPAGSFTGDPRMVQRAIMGIKDPVERERAMQAWRLQMNDPAKNAELLMANRAAPVAAPAQPVAAPAQPVAAPVQAEPAQKPMATMASTVAPKPFELSPQVMERRNALVAQAEYAAKVNPSALPGIQDRINKFDMGARASAVQAHVMSMDQRSFDALVARADTNPQFEAKAQSDGKGGAVLTIGEKQVKLSRSQAADWLTGLYLMEQGDVDGGRMMIASVNKDLADVSGKHMDWNLKARAEARQEAQLGLNQSADARAGNAEERAAQKFDLEVEELKRSQKIPPLVKAQIQHLQDTLKIQQTAIAKSQAEGSFNEASPSAQALLKEVASARRQLERIVGGAGAVATPPKSIADLEAESAAAKPSADQGKTAPPQAPQQKVLSNFEMLRQQKIADEAAALAAARQAQNQAREAERQRLLQQRPDLQTMGGMRFFN